MYFALCTLHSCCFCYSVFLCAMHWIRISIQLFSGKVIKVVARFSELYSVRSQISSIVRKCAHARAPTLKYSATRFGHDFRTFHFEIFSHSFDMDRFHQIVLHFVFVCVFFFLRRDDEQSSRLRHTRKTIYEREKKTSNNNEQCTRNICRYLQQNTKEVL